MFLQSFIAPKNITEAANICILHPEICTVIVLICEKAALTV
jgi:hypothetical protein